MTLALNIEHQTPRHKDLTDKSLSDPILPDAILFSIEEQNIQQFVRARKSA